MTSINRDTSPDLFKIYPNSQKGVWLISYPDLPRSGSHFSTVQARVRSGYEINRYDGDLDLFGSVPTISLIFYIGNFMVYGLIQSWKTTLNLVKRSYFANAHYAVSENPYLS